MKILPVQINPLYKNNFAPHIKLNNQGFNNPVDFKGVSNVYYIDYNLNKLKYSYKPIASTKPITGLVGHYYELDKFSELFASKVNSQLLVPTEDDIENLITRIQFKTKASKKQIMEVLYNLTAFSGYKSFNFISKTVDRFNIEQFGLGTVLYNSSTSDSLTNCAINYLTFQKQFCERKFDKIGIILDNQTLKAIESLKNSTNNADKENYKIFIKHIEYGNVVFLNLKGWDIKTAFNGYKSANFLTGSGFLEDLAVETINNLKNGKTEDEIYYSDFKERLFGLFKGDVEADKINIIEINPQDKRENITSNDILDNVKPKTLSKEWIKAVIKSYVLYKYDYDESKVEKIASFLKYLDEQTHVFSVDSLALALKNLYGKVQEAVKRINNKGVSYIIPDEKKSFSLVSTMYALINGINSEDIDFNYRISTNNKGKNRVVLDDISASGVTERKIICNYRVYQDDGAKIIYAPVILCKKAEKSQKNKYDNPDEHCHEFYIKDLSEIKDFVDSRDFPRVLDDKETDRNSKIEKILKEDFKLLQSNDTDILLDKLDTGYNGLTLSVMFPYMIPDNCSDLVSLIFKELLYCNNSETNKPMKYYQIKENTHQIELYQKIDEYAKALISSGKV